MARSRSKNRKIHILDTLQEKGFAACAAGVVMLLLPVLVGNSKQFSGVAATISGYGWWAIALGVVFLGLPYLVAKSQSKSAGSQQTGNGSSKPQPRNRKTPPASTARTEPQWSDGSRTAAPLASHASAASAPGALPQPPTTWSAGVFAAIEWRRFEAVCEALFAQAGFETKSQPHGADGGVDIWLHSRNAEGPVAVVQCKHWPEIVYQLHAVCDCTESDGPRRCFPCQQPAIGCKKRLAAHPDPHRHSLARVMYTIPSNPCA